MIAVTCGACGEVFNPKRPDARFCSGRCRVAAHRKGGQDAVTDDPSGLYQEPLVTAPAPPAAVPDGHEAAFGPAVLTGDTIPGRRWRVVMVDGGYQLEVDALVPGSWKAVVVKPTMIELRRFAAWCGLALPV